LFNVEFGIEESRSVSNFVFFSEMTVSTIMNHDKKEFYLNYTFFSRYDITNMHSSFSNNGREYGEHMYR
jgi:hypothetical protein